MDLILVLLIGIAIGFSLGIGLKLEIWKRKISSALTATSSRSNSQLSTQKRTLNRPAESAKNIHQKLRPSLQRSAILTKRHLAEGQDHQETTAVKALEESSQEVIEHVSRDKLRLALFLWSKGVKIKSLEASARNLDGKLNNQLNHISNFMGDRYSSIKKLYKSIKSSMNEGEAFSLCLKDEPQQVVSDSCQLANLLLGAAFLEEYRYFKSPKFILEARPSRSPDALNFLSGGWLERYVKGKLVKVAGQQGKKVSYLANAQVTLPNGNDFEMDLFFCVNDRFYWVESKTGDYHESINKYSSLASELSLQKSQVFLVLTDVDQDRKISLSSIYRLSVIGVDDVEPTFVKILKS